MATEHNNGSELDPNPIGVETPEPETEKFGTSGCAIPIGVERNEPETEKFGSLDCTIPIGVETKLFKFTVLSFLRQIHPRGNRCRSCEMEIVVGLVRWKSLMMSYISSPFLLCFALMLTMAIINHPTVISLINLVKVTLQDGRRLARRLDGKVVNGDMHSDIAIVKINSETPLPEAKLGSSSTLRPGDLVIAMGCPHSLQNTVTAGIVSCVDRKSSDLGFNGTPREYLQTDCAINEGNSGGPLVNMDGEVIGVNLMKMMAAVGLSFSVPIDSLPKIIEHFKKNGVQPWIGLKGLDLNEMINALLQKIDASFPNVDKGILVSMATPGSPSDYAGFRPGDVVVEFDGKPVESMNEVIERMGDKVGVPIKVLVKRGSDKLVTLTVIPEEANLDV